MNKTSDMRTYMKKYREKRKAKGVCLTCGKQAERNRVRCRTCVGRANEAAKAKRDRYSAEGKCVICGILSEKGRCDVCRKKSAEKNLEDQHRRRAIVLEAYGGKCTCCGEDEEVFLCIDHINNNGAAHRREIGGGGGVTYRWLIKNNFPPGFQVLCRNCNWAKQILGACPHYPA